MPESSFFLDGVEVRARRSARAAGFRLRVTRGLGEASLVLPARATRAAAERFLKSHRDWLRERVAAAEGAIPFRPGAIIPYRGEPHELRRDPLRRGGPALAGGGALHVPGAPERFADALAHWLKERARAELTVAATRYAAALDRPAPRIFIRDQRSRWGSCAASGALSFSWRLIMAPPSVLDYLAAHECAHLVEMNHSPRFWALVARLKPDHAGDEAWLKARGPDLQRYGRLPPEPAPSRARPRSA